MLELWKHSSNPPDVAPPLLPYAPSDPVEVRRERRRRMWWILVYVGALCVVLALGRRVQRNWSDWREQSRIATFVEPADTVTYDVNSAIGKPVFLHERRTSDDAHPRIVIVEGVMSTSAEVFLRSKVFKRFSLWDAPTVDDVSSDSAELTISKFFAGQPDAKDASHFTVRYEATGGQGTIDGWLQPDDTIKFEVRDGPLAAR